MAPPRCRPSTRAEEADSRPARELAAEAFGAQVVERAKALVCYGRLTALGAPRRLEFLNGEWRRCFSEPYISGRPHYVRSCVDESGCEFESHLFHADDHWYITPGAAGGGMVLCGARSDSLGPMTVDPKQWHHPTAGGSGALMPEFEFVVDGPNTEDEPFLMEELGLDFFLRGAKRLGTRHVVWFRCPSSGQVYHSAAKPGGSGGRSRPGKRYCPLCHKCFSANNFAHQHLANLHRPSKIEELSATHESHGGLLLQWSLAAPNGLPIKQYAVNCSADGGASWHDCVHVSVTHARIGAALLRPGVAYSFRVAGINLAGTGPDSDPSPGIGRLRSPEMQRLTCQRPSIPTAGTDFAAAEAGCSSTQSAAGAATDVPTTLVPTILPTASHLSSSLVRPSHLHGLAIPPHDLGYESGGTEDTAGVRSPLSKSRLGELRLDFADALGSPGNSTLASPAGGPSSFGLFPTAGPSSQALGSPYNSALASPTPGLSGQALGSPYPSALGSPTGLFSHNVCLVAPGPWNYDLGSLNSSALASPVGPPSLSLFSRRQNGAAAGSPAGPQFSNQSPILGGPASPSASTPGSALESVTAGGGGGRGGAGCGSETFAATHAPAPPPAFPASPPAFVSAAPASVASQPRMEGMGTQSCASTVAEAPFTAEALFTAADHTPFTPAEAPFTPADLPPSHRPESPPPPEAPRKRARGGMWGQSSGGGGTATASEQSGRSPSLAASQARSPNLSSPQARSPSHAELKARSSSLSSSQASLIAHAIVTPSRKPIAFTVAQPIGTVSAAAVAAAWGVPTSPDGFCLSSPCSPNASMGATSFHPTEAQLGFWLTEIQQCAQEDETRSPRTDTQPSPRMDAHASPRMDTQASPRMNWHASPRVDTPAGMRRVVSQQSCPGGEGWTAQVCAGGETAPSGSAGVSEFPPSEAWVAQTYPADDTAPPRDTGVSFLPSGLGVAQSEPPSLPARRRPSPVNLPHALAVVAPPGSPLAGPPSSILFPSPGLPPGISLSSPALPCSPFLRSPPRLGGLRGGISWDPALMREAAALMPTDDLEMLINQARQQGQAPGSGYPEGEHGGQGRQDGGMWSEEMLINQARQQGQAGGMHGGEGAGPCWQGRQEAGGWPEGMLTNQARQGGAGGVHGEDGVIASWQGRQEAGGYPEGLRGGQAGQGRQEAGGWSEGMPQPAVQGGTEVTTSPYAASTGGMRGWAPQGGASEAVAPPRAAAPGKGLKGWVRRWRWGGATAPPPPVPAADGATMPSAETAGPNLGSAIPNRDVTAPDSGSAVPDRGVAGPNWGSAVPNRDVLEIGHGRRQGGKSGAQRAHQEEEGEEMAREGTPAASAWPLPAPAPLPAPVALRSGACPSSAHAWPAIGPPWVRQPSAGPPSVQQAAASRPSAHAWPATAPPSVPQLAAGHPSVPKAATEAPSVQQAQAAPPVQQAAGGPPAVQQVSSGPLPAVPCPPSAPPSAPSSFSVDAPYEAPPPPPNRAPSSRALPIHALPPQPSPAAPPTTAAKVSPSSFSAGADLYDAPSPPLSHPLPSRALPDHASPSQPSLAASLTTAAGATPASFSADANPNASPPPPSYSPPTQEGEASLTFPLVLLRDRLRATPPATKLALITPSLLIRLVDAGHVTAARLLISHALATGATAEQLVSEPEQLGATPEELGALPEQVGGSSETVGEPPEQQVVAPEQHGKTPKQVGERLEQRIASPEQVAASGITAIERVRATVAAFPAAAMSMHAGKWHGAGEKGGAVGGAGGVEIGGAMGSAIRGEAGDAKGGAMGDAMGGAMGAEAGGQARAGGDAWPPSVSLPPEKAAVGSHQAACSREAIDLHQSSHSQPAATSQPAVHAQHTGVKGWSADSSESNSSPTPLATDSPSPAVLPGPRPPTRLGLKAAVAALLNSIAGPHGPNRSRNVSTTKPHAAAAEPSPNATATEQPAAAAPKQSCPDPQSATAAAEQSPNATATKPHADSSPKYSIIAAKSAPAGECSSAQASVPAAAAIVVYAAAAPSNRPFAPTATAGFPRLISAPANPPLPRPAECRNGTIEPAPAVPPSRTSAHTAATVAPPMQRLAPRRTLTFGLAAVAPPSRPSSPARFVSPSQRPTLFRNVTAKLVPRPPDPHMIEVRAGMPAVLPMARVQSCP